MTFATAVIAGGAVVGPAPCSDQFLDSFSRTVAEGIQPDLGTSDSGHTWVWLGGGTDYVVMGSGFLRFIGPRNGGEGSSQQWALVLGSFVIPGLATATAFEFRFRTNFIHTVSTNLTKIEVELVSDSNVDVKLGVSNAAGGKPSGGYVDLNLAAAAKADWLADTWYTARVVIDLGTGDEALYVWADGDPMGSPLVTDSGGWTPGTGPGEIDVTVDINASVLGVDLFGQTVDLDYIAWRDCP